MLIQFSSVVQSYPTLCDPMDCSTPGLPVHCQLPELTQTHIHRVGDAIQPSHPLLSLSPAAPNPSQHQSLFQWTLRMRWPKYWSFSFSIITSKEHPGLISFRLGISQLKCTGMGEFNSDDHYIYYFGHESLRRNGVAIIGNKRVQKFPWMQSQKGQNYLCSFPI